MILPLVSRRNGKVICLYMLLASITFKQQRK